MKAIIKPVRLGLILWARKAAAAHSGANASAHLSCAFAANNIFDTTGKFASAPLAIPGHRRRIVLYRI